MLGPDVIVLVEPARRHRCEICQEIFECHLCDIRHWHPAHIERGLTNGFMFVCEECCASPENRFQARKSEVIDLLRGRQL